MATMSADNRGVERYRRLRAALDAPPPHLFAGPFGEWPHASASRDSIGPLSPHSLAELPESADAWALPTRFVSREDVRDRLLKWPHPQCVVAAATVVEMALPVFFSGRRMRESGEYPSLPALALEALQTWLDGDANAEKLAMLVRMARDMAGATAAEGPQVPYAAHATAFALQAAQDHALAATHTMRAAFCFADAMSEWQRPVRQPQWLDPLSYYVAHWWRRCQWRLAFADAPTATLE